MSIKIIVDSTADLLPEQASRVEVVPLTIHFGEKEYTDGVTIDSRMFYSLLVESDELPTTSQATPFAFGQVFEKALADGSEAICITCSSKLSGTYQSAVIAAEDFDGRVAVVDSQSIALGSAILVEYALELVDRGLSAEQIVLNLLRKREKIRMLAMLDTLEYLKKGGRLSAAVAVVGGLLNIKPIIQIEAPGEIKVAGTARGMKKAFSTLNDLAGKFGGPDAARPMLLGYTGVNCENLTKYLEESGSAWASHISSTWLGSAIGVHVGPGAVAFAFFEAEK